MEPTIYFVIPCYNEEAVLPETTRRLTEKLEAMRQAGLLGPDSRILYVNDGSKDKTWELISRYHQENPWVEGVKLAHNRGHQNALITVFNRRKQHCARNNRFSASDIALQKPLHRHIRRNVF